MKPKRLITIFLFTLICSSILAESGIYVGGYFRRQRTVAVPTLKASGFTTVILFNIEVQPNGDLTADQELICSNGEYVFDKLEPYYIDDVNALVTGKTSINRVEACVGGWTDQSYSRIKTLIASGGASENSILYKNFKALKEAIPVIEAINNDDEGSYDVSSAVQFHIMLYDIGFKTTTAPYTQKTFWQNFVTQINNARPGAVDRIYLQCYSGGAGNVGNPDAWKVGNVPLYAGLLNSGANYTVANVNTQMNAWKNSSSVCGGFLWVYNDNTVNLKNYANAINVVFGGGEVVNRDKLKPHVTLYSEKNYGETSADFEIGKYSAYAISIQNFSIQSLSSVKVFDGFKLLLYKNDYQAGEYITIKGEVPDISQLDGAGAFSSIAVVADNDMSFKGKDVCIQNSKSNLYLCLAENKINAGIGIVQKEYQNNMYEQWTLKLSEDSCSYYFVQKRTGRSLQVVDGSIEDEPALEQAVGVQEMNQKFIVVPCENASCYKIISLYSLTYLGIEKGKEEDVDASVVQKSDKNDESTDWIFLDPNAISGIIENKIAMPYSVSPNPATDFLYIKNESVPIRYIKISSLRGEEIAYPKLDRNKIDISNLPKGIYFLYILPENTIKPVICKFIKI